jgi:hypothetical protein
LTEGTFSIGRGKQKKRSHVKTKWHWGSEPDGTGACIQLFSGLWWSRGTDIGTYRIPPQRALLLRRRRRLAS